MANPNPKPAPPNTGKKYNRTVMDPRVDMFKQFYLSPESYTFMNIRRSALRAGYTDQYARNISVQRPKWWQELTESAELERAQMLQKAQSNLHKTLEQNPESDTQLKIKTDVSKFITERLGKEHYSARQELTDKGGKRLFQKDNERAALVADLFKGVQSAPQQSKQ